MLIFSCDMSITHDMAEMNGIYLIIILFPSLKLVTYKIAINIGAVVIMPLKTCELRIVGAIIDIITVSNDIVIHKTISIGRVVIR